MCNILFNNAFEVKRVAKQIKIEITSRNGHDEVMCDSVLEAKQVIQQHSEQGKWLYVDGRFTRMDELTNDAIADAQQIRMVAALVGG